MKRLICGILSAFALLSSVTVQGATRLEALAEDNMELALVVRDLSGLLEDWAESPLSRMFNQREVRHALGDLGQRLTRDYWAYQADKKLGYSLDELDEGLPGGLLVVAPQAGKLFGETAEYGVVLEAGADSAPALAVASYLFLGKDAKELESAADYFITEERFFGETLHLRQARDEEDAAPLGWARMEGFVVMARSETLLKALVAAAKDGEAQNPWIEGEAYRRFAEQTPQWELLVYLKGAGITPLLSGYMEAQSATPEAPEETAEVADSAAMAETPAAFVEQFAEGFLGENIHGLFLAAHLDDGAVELDLQTLYEEDEGLIGLLAYRPGPMELPEFVPSDAQQVSVSNFDFSAMWQAARETLNEVAILAPANAMLKTSLASASESAGFDVEQTLLDSLGQGLVQMELPQAEAGDGAESNDSPEVTDHLSVFRIRDRKSLESALESIKQGIGWSAMLERNAYLDIPVYTYSEAALGGADPADSPAYAVTDDYLIYGSRVAPVHRLLSRLTKARSTDSYWDRDETSRVIQDLPEGYSEILLAEGDHFAHSLYQILQMIPYSATPARGNRCQPQPQLERAKLSGFLGPALGVTYKGDGVFRSIYRWTAADADGQD